MSPQNKLADPIAQAREHYRAGRKSQAENICRELLAKSPRNDAAWQLLGVMALDVKREEFAIQAFMRALDIAPQKPGYYVNLAVSLHRLGKVREAVEALRLAISLKPDLAEAHFNLARCLIDLGEDEMAYAAVETAAQLQPSNFEIQCHFARVLRVRGEYARSIEPYRLAISADPGSVECLTELATVFRALGKVADGLELARRAVELSPQSAVTNNELGLSLLLNNQPDDAIQVLSLALNIDPDSTDVRCSLGYALEAVGRLEEAVEIFRQVLRLDPTLHNVHSNIIFLLPFIPGVDSQTVLDEAHEWNRAFAEAIGPEPLAHGNDRNPERRLRIGYVSSHFYNHCQSLFTTPLFENHNRDKFETFAYSCVESPDAVTSRLQENVGVWRDVARLNDVQLAEAIREDRIDILVDLAMHMGNGKLKVFAQKPAPIQYCWLAYPGTTGLPAIDYRITDRYLDPAEIGDGPYSERSVIMPDTFWCYDPMTSDVDCGPLPAIDNHFVTFGCLNHFRKVNQGLLELWANVLNLVSESRLLLLVPPGQTQLQITRFFERLGIAGQRIMFTERKPRAEYLEQYRRIDICLDTFPYCGHTTSMDAFWMGVPVVSLVGPLLVGRAAITIANNLSLQELVTFTPNDYVNVASQLATNVSRLREVRSKLRTRMQTSPLMDGRRFARYLESAYRMTWQHWCEDKGPERAPILIG
jgi:predicted O-linked N-acetylglucosamine transferase (SPINDLY family)